jgi:hypothetical protein
MELLGFLLLPHSARHLVMHTDQKGRKLEKNKMIQEALFSIHLLLR